MAGRLSKIDAVLGEVYEYIKERDMGLFVTSLYGIQKDVYNQKTELLKINFSGRRPLIIWDPSINLSSYTISEGSLNELANSIYTNINKEYKEPGLIKKKSSLLSFLYKKPKGDKK